jgi:hypothetical protein
MLSCSVGVDTGWSSDGDCLTMKPDGRLSRAMRHEILQCLRETQQMCGAARLLGLGRQTLYNHVEAFGIVPGEWRGVQPLVEYGPAMLPLLLQELSRLVARYSCAGTAMPTPIDAVVVAEIPVPSSNGSPGECDRACSDPFPPHAQSADMPAPASAISRDDVMAISRSRPQPKLGNDGTIHLFLRLGIDLRRKNLSKRRHGFWLRFEGELDYLLVDARSAYLAKIKQAHPDCGGSTEEAASLSVAWRLIRRRFARRGITF